MTLNSIEVSGNSMEPVLFSGDQLEVEWTDDLSSIKLGEILVFKDAHHAWIVHRKIGKNGLKGDRSLAIDHLSSGVFGKLVRINQAPYLYNWADRWIAKLSKYSAHSKVLRRILRPVIFGMGWLRRRRWI